MWEKHSRSWNQVQPVPEATGNNVSKTQQVKDTDVLSFASYPVLSRRYWDVNGQDEQRWWTNKNMSEGRCWGPAAQSSEASTRVQRRTRWRQNKPYIQLTLEYEHSEFRLCLKLRFYISCIWMWNIFLQQICEIKCQFPFAQLHICIHIHTDWFMAQSTYHICICAYGSTTAGLHGFPFVVAFACHVCGILASVRTYWW